MTLDLHGTVTRRMVESCAAILGYERYPHTDVRQTGERAARLLLRIMAGAVHPVTALARVPLLATAFNASTEGDGPFARLMREAKRYEGHPPILATSLFFVGSYIDIAEMTSTVVVVADRDVEAADRTARFLAERFWERRREFDVPIVSVAQAVARGREIEGGPVLLLDTADTTGGGAAGDSSDVIRDLLVAGVTEPCLAMVVDPEAAEACHTAGVGSEVTLQLGHRVDPRWGSPVEVTGVVQRLLDGRFRYTGGILGGSWATMGRSAVLRIGSISVLIMTYATYDWADEQYRAAGLVPAEAKFVGVKNMMNFRYAYGDVMKAAFVLDLPGPTAPDMRALPFRRVRRPIYPLDDLAEPRIDVVASMPG
jgi:microcystin degradation protein MlrC